MEKGGIDKQRPFDRRHLLIGGGAAALTWTAPTIARVDVAGAQGTGMGGVVEVTPFSIPANVTPAPNVTDTIAGESVFGLFGRGDADNGPIFAATFDAAPPHTQVRITTRICFKDTWEGAGSAARFQDEIDVRIDGASAPGFPLLPGPLSDTCVTYDVTVPHTGATLTVEYEGTVTAIPEDYGVASIIVEYL